MAEIGHLTIRSFYLVTVFQCGHSIDAAILAHHLLGFANIGLNRIVARPELDGVQHQNVDERANSTHDGHQDKAYDGVKELAARHVVLPVDVLVPQAILTNEA